MATVVTPSTLNTKIASLLAVIANALNVNVNLISNTFRAVLTCDDGQRVRLRVTSLDQAVADPGNASGISGDGISSALVAPTGVQGTLTAGVVTLNLANNVGDQLSVVLVAAGGTPGVLSVRRTSGTQVQVQSWLAGVGIQTADTSVVKVFNFGQVAL